MKKKVYLFESNIPMGKTVYLPLVSGILRGYAESIPVLKENYEFMPFIFVRDTPENLLKNYKDPFIAAFSVCSWNHQLSLAVAKLVKEKFPHCKIIFGGPQVESVDTQLYPFIDYAVLEEGEKKFASLLLSFISQKHDISKHNLEDYPSPYTLGLYEQTILDYPDTNFQAIVETNRGCPFTCTFCYWGQGFEEKKVRHHSLDYVRKEAEWIGKNKIKYVFMADANFGMYDRDYDVAKIYCEVKEKYGYPEKIRVCYGKNKEENVFRTAKLLSKYGLAKAVTLARQSNDLGVLDNIRRSNIKLGVYSSLQDRYHSEGIPTYTEIILGLPGETLDSFKKGVDEVASSNTQLFIYHCSILRNTEMADPEYMQRYGIKTVRVPMAEIHCSERKEGFVQEYEDIVIETNTMPKEDWIECAVYSWIAQLKNSFDTNASQEVISKFYEIARNITNGSPRGQLDYRFGDIYWEPEEMAFLMMALDSGNIKGDLQEYAREVVLFGRKSKVHQPPIGV